MVVVVCFLPIFLLLLTDLLFPYGFALYMLLLFFV